MSALVIPRFVFCLAVAAASAGTLGCTASDDATSETDVAGAESGATGMTTGSTACEPESEIACACVDGSTGVQTCLPSGASYGECMCGADPQTTGDATSGGPMADDGVGDTTGSDAAGSDAGDSGDPGEASSSGGEPVCRPGAVVACDCGEGSGAAVCNDGGTAVGECQCCQGSQPIMQGDLSVCEAGACSCATFDGDVPVLTCYAEALAGVCCLAEPTCF